MDYPIHVWDCTFCILKGFVCHILYQILYLRSRLKLLLLSLSIVSILANSADTDEMPHYAVFHLDLHCLPKYLFTGIQNENG